mmetsp:Transcript_14012/g.16513  ORF Transcript_14012/g.16513 Transcript_14012/m.16513 type:complete len:387 (-) Transcript_14012:242-1402(-)
MMIPRVHVLFLLLAPSIISSFVLLPSQGIPKSALNLEQRNQFHPHHDDITTALHSSENDQPTTSVYIDSTLTDARVRSLFAWVSRAFAGDDEYNNLMLAMAAIFGTNLPPDSTPIQMAKNAEDLLPTSEEALTGEPFPRSSRERSSLGAMGAGQWMGQFKTRPHSLLDVSPQSNITSIDDWVRTLPRGCRRTLKKANAQNFTVTTRPISDRKRAPHSSLAHFRCVVEHEVRLITEYDDDTEGFLEALSMSVGRYIDTTHMTGEIQEYRNAEGRIIAFAHEVRKGRAIRGQWFYSSDEAAKSYVWFHSVQELARKAIEADGIDTADLGPSGSDAFSELKSKYGFAAVDDWPAVADYTGPFWYADEQVTESTSDESQTVKDLMKLLGE